MERIEIARTFVYAVERFERNAERAHGGGEALRPDDDFFTAQKFLLRTLRQIGGVNSQTDDTYHVFSFERYSIRPARKRPSKA